jgi:WD40 repeat protein
MCGRTGRRDMVSHGEGVYLCAAWQVRSIAVDGSGQWLASGSDDGSVRVWEVQTGRCMRSWQVGGCVHCVAWCPAAGMRIVAAAVGSKLVLLPAGGSLCMPYSMACRSLDAAFECTVGNLKSMGVS